MNIHSRSKVGRFTVGQPVVVGKPRVRCGDRHQFPGARMVQVVTSFSFLIENGFHTWHLLEQFPDPVNVFALSDVDMGNLVIGNSKSPAGTRNEYFPSQLLPDRY